MEPGRPAVARLAVPNGRGLSTGTRESMRPRLTNTKVTIDNAFGHDGIMPGLIEAREHLGMSAGSVALPFVATLARLSPIGMNDAIELEQDSVCNFPIPEADPFDVEVTEAEGIRVRGTMPGVKGLEANPACAGSVLKWLPGV